MDYTRAPLTFRARKAARYMQLYGPSRTIVKIRGQYHMRRTGGLSVVPLKPADPGAHVGLIGCGNFAFSHIAYFLTRAAGPVIRGVMDVEGARAESLARRYGAGYATEDAARIIHDPEIDIVYVSSNHASHADYAIAALEAGKSVHIEKPHVVDEPQLVRLCRAMEKSTGRVQLGFNRPDSALGKEARRLVGAQQGTLMLNWFVAGHEIAPDHWYYRPEEGGRVLGNLCHWSDFSLQMVEPDHRFPIEIRPARAEQSDADIAVSYVFADGSIAAITFSAKGHAFEGVRERCTLHKGDLLLSLDDFKELRADVGERRHRTRLRFRNHGHGDAILRSYRMSDRAGAVTASASIAYVWETAQLFLQTRIALESDRIVTVEAFDPARLVEMPAAAG